jgi:hypothetical protein
MAHCIALEFVCLQPLLFYHFPTVLLFIAILVPTSPPLQIMALPVFAPPVFLKPKVRI